MLQHSKWILAKRTLFICETLHLPTTARLCSDPQAICRDNKVWVISNTIQNQIASSTIQDIQKWSIAFSSTTNLPNISSETHCSATAVPSDAENCISWTNPLQHTLLFYNAPVWTLPSKLNKWALWLRSGQVLYKYIDKGSWFKRFLPRVMQPAAVSHSK